MTTLHPDVLAEIEKGQSLGKWGNGHFIHGETEKEFATRIALLATEKTARECAEICETCNVADQCADAIREKFGVKDEQ